MTRLVDVDIVDAVGGGRGIAHVGDEVWMIAGGLPGERVEARLERRRAGVVEAVALRVLTSSHPARLAQPCPRAVTCGGCDWPHVDAAAGAALKSRVAAGAARSQPELAARLANAPVRASAASYRLRSRLHWDPDSRRLGFYGRQSWTVAAIEGCSIVSPRLDATRSRLEEALVDRCPQAVDLEWLEDLDGRTAVVALRSARGGPKLIDPRWLPPVESVGEAVEGIHRLDARGRIESGWGARSVVMDLPTPLQVPIGAFFQGNRHLVRWMFHRVRELAGSEPIPAFDLHGGVGFLAAAIDTGDRPIVVIEPHRASARAARRNLPKAEVVVGRTAEAWLRTAGRLPRRALAVADPPRTGLSRELLGRLADWYPRRILMIACDPATWARDTGRLLERGYRLAHVELVDLFPHTHHVEVLSTLEAT